jgi:DNA-directed RNA polymerase subunit RPC12/RpoP
MGIINDSLNGIFISDEAREDLNIKLSEEEFQKLKDTIKNDYDPDDYKKCFITNRMTKIKDGLFLSPTWMADSLEKVLESKDKLHDLFKQDIIVCGNCGEKVKFTDRHVKCPKCGHETNSKVYGKSIKLGAAKRITFKLYINFLRKQKK